MKKKRASKPKFVIILEFIPFWLTYKLFRILNLRIAYFIARQLCMVFFLLDFRHRNRTVSHLMHAGIATSRKEALKIARQVFVNFSMTIVEMFKFDQIVNRIKFRLIGNAESCRLLTDSSKQNIIAVSAHYGNWELAGNVWSGFAGIPMVSVMRKFDNPLIGKYILEKRSGPTHHCVEKDGSMKVLFKALKQGKYVAILADQHANSREGVETSFFGQPCRTHASPALLHLKTGVPIIPNVSRRTGNELEFEFVMGDPIRYAPTDDSEADVRNVAQRYTDELEKLIRQQPEQWLWAHRRWLNINRKSAASYQTSQHQQMA